MPQRAIFWPARGTLFIADLHLGKSESLRADGAPLPRRVAQGVGDESLKRLSLLIALTEATRVVILGDLLHRPTGITPQLVDQVAAWRLTFPAVRLLLVPGNHDRRFEHVVGPWNLEVSDDARRFEPPFSLSHFPTPCDEHFNLAGHIHPAISLASRDATGFGRTSRADRVKLPCFHFTPRGCVLPAFSRFTAGDPITHNARTDAVFAIADDCVIDVTRSRVSAPRPAPTHA